MQSTLFDISLLIHYTNPRSALLLEHTSHSDKEILEYKAWLLMSVDLWGIMVNAIVVPDCDYYNADIGNGSGGIKGGEGHLPPPRRGSRQPQDPPPS